MDNLGEESQNPMLLGSSDALSSVDLDAIDPNVSSNPPNITYAGGVALYAQQGKPASFDGVTTTSNIIFSKPPLANVLSVTANQLLLDGQPVGGGVVTNLTRISQGTAFVACGTVNDIRADTTTAGGGSMRILPIGYSNKPSLTLNVTPTINTITARTDSGVTELNHCGTGVVITGSGTGGQNITMTKDSITNDPFTDIQCGGSVVTMQTDSTDITTANLSLQASTAMTIDTPSLVINGLPYPQIPPITSISNANGSVTCQPTSVVDVASDTQINLASPIVRLTGTKTEKVEILNNAVNLQAGSINQIADAGISVYNSTYNVNAVNGTGGKINLYAQPGTLGVSGGAIELLANGGSGPGGLYGAINITANQGTNSTTGISLGGAINITANSGSAVANATSKINLNAGGINIYSGISAPIASLFGYTFLNALSGISNVVGLTYSSAMQVPGTIYNYAVNGINFGSDVYMTNIYPYWNGVTAPADMNLNGRVTVSGTARVNMSRAGTIAFDSGGSGAITGVKTINGSSYPPATSTPTAIQNGSASVTCTSGNNSVQIATAGTGGNGQINVLGGTQAPDINISTSSTINENANNINVVAGATALVQGTTATLSGKSNESVSCSAGKIQLSTTGQLATTGKIIMNGGSLAPDISISTVTNLSSTANITTVTTAIYNLIATANVSFSGALSSAITFISGVTSIVGQAVYLRSTVAPIGLTSTSSSISILASTDAFMQGNQTIIAGKNNEQLTMTGGTVTLATGRGITLALPSSPYPVNTGLVVNNIAQTSGTNQYLTYNNITGLVGWDGTNTITGGGMPIGAMMTWCAGNVNGPLNYPTGYLVCRGQTYNSTAYPELYAVLQQTWGGSATASPPTFALPNTMGRVSMGSMEASYSSIINITRTVTITGGGLNTANNGWLISSTQNPIYVGMLFNFGGGFGVKKIVQVLAVEGAGDGYNCPFYVVFENTTPSSYPAISGSQTLYTWLGSGYQYNVQAPLVGLQPGFTPGNVSTSLGMGSSYNIQQIAQTSAHTHPANAGQGGGTTTAGSSNPVQGNTTGGTNGLFSGDGVVLTAGMTRVPPNFGVFYLIYAGRA